jgi:hypothetical protein
MSSTLTRIRNAVGLSPTWPPADQVDVWETCELLAGLRDSNIDTVSALAAWAGMGADNAAYLPMPMARMISRVKANLLFGEAPELTASNDTDQALLDDLVDENDLQSELHRAAVLASSEGDVYGKVTVAPDVLDRPIIEFVSRRRVIPRFVGRFLVGAVFVTEYRDPAQTYSSEVWRQLEDQQPGQVVTRLYRGTNTRLGDPVPLTERPETAELAMNDGRSNVVVTGIERPLCVFVPNALDDDPTRGVSDYLGVMVALLAINESETIGASNARLTGRARLFVEGRYLDAWGRLPAGNDVFRSDQVIAEGARDGGPVKAAQYSFGSAELVAWLDHVIDLSLTLAGVSPQSVGRSVDGGAVSGTALRLKMSHSLMEAAGTGRYFDRGVSQLLRMAALLDQRWFARRWTAPDELPGVSRGDGLPADAVEDSQVITALVGAEAMSRETAIRTAHPEWSDEQVAAELERMSAEAQQAADRMAQSLANRPGQRPPGQPGENVPPGGGPIPTPAPTVSLGGNG